MKKQIMTGVESFEEIIKGKYFYIDKTLFIKELLEGRGKVTLITRPRRFGKTLNMSMLEHFFDMDMDSRPLFDGLNIMQHRDIVDNYLNKHPVVSLTLKDVAEDSYESSVEKIKELVSEMYEDSLHLYESGNLNQRQKDKFHSIFMGNPTDIELKSSLKFLTSCLYAHHGRRAIVLLDEYDRPIENALAKGHYAEMVDFMRGFMGNAFKINKHMEFGVLTGVLRVSGESLLSSFNNPIVCGVMDKEFTTSFGFTEDEVKDACGIYGVGDKYDEVREWYDGYRFGGRDMYNPWSITRYLERQKFDNYWVNTGSVRILQDVFYKGDDSLRDDLAGLLTGIPISMSLEDGITYPIKYVNSDTFWTLLLNAGYIKPCNGAEGDRFEAELVNKEIFNIFSRYAKNWFSEQQPSISEAILEFIRHLLSGDAESVSAALNNDLLNNPSSHDFKMENSYHMFIYGMLLAASGDYIVQSNQESGKGRADCVIKPKDKSKSAVIVEFKHVKQIPQTGLRQEALQGLEQIKERAHAHSLINEGYHSIFKYGIAFHNKSCEVAMSYGR